MKELSGSGFTVVGAGKSGIAAANVLAGRGAVVRLVDDAPERARPPGLAPEVVFVAGSHSVRAGDDVVLSPGISEVSPVRADVARDAAEVLGELELFYRLCRAPILAVTGTDGKSTVTTMLGDILRAHGQAPIVGGNLGNPLCGELDRAASVVVAEVSAFQLTTCLSFRPRVAVITNIAEDHLEYHGTFGRYVAAKRRVAANMGSGDVLVLNLDCHLVASTSAPLGVTVRGFSTRRRADAWLDGDELRVDDETLMTRAELTLPGRHNVANALAAALAAKAWGVPLPAIRGALVAYRALPHRLELVMEEDGVRWLDDSKATNPNAASAALRAIDGPIVLLAGGADKGCSLDGLAALVRSRTRAAILFGAARHRLADAIGPEHPTIVLGTLIEAVSAARRLARTGDTMLLSPACSSFDEFRSYAHRGEVFRALLRGVEVCDV